MNVSPGDIVGPLYILGVLPKKPQIPGPTGPAGADGKSAYQIWLDQGNTGTVQDFLNSLVGADGKSAYQVWLDAGNTGTESDFLQSLIGATGPSGASSSLYFYDADATHTSGNPGVHQLLWNNATQINATQLNISYITADSIDIDIFLSLITPEQKIIIQDANLSDNYQQFVVTDTPTEVTGTDNYWIIPVSYISSGGTGTTNFPNTHKLIVAIFATGPVGPAGPTGPAGPPGSSAVAGEIPSGQTHLLTNFSTSSSTFVDVPGASTSVTIETTAHIAALVNCVASSANGQSRAEFRISIGGTDISDETSDDLTNIEETISLNHRTVSQFAAGTYTVQLQMRQVSGSGTPTLVHADLLALGLQGAIGPSGKSAYQSWLDQGNVGTEAQFIQSLSEQADTITITQTMLDNKYLDLTYSVADPLKVFMTIYGGVDQRANVDFTVTGNRLSWDQLALELLLQLNDAIVVRYKPSFS